MSEAADTDLSDDEPRVLSHLDFAVVGIGASAGGVRALTAFFEAMPADSGMAFVIVLHLSATHESHLDAILGNVTTMPVLRVTQATPIEVNHVYVISPALQLSMKDGHLLVSELKRVQGRPIAIDVFFRTLAEVHRERAVSIVLSGAGADGAVGIARVKECGGITFVQAPDDAEQSGMPSAAIATGSVDFVLAVADIPRRLVEVVANAKRIRLPTDIIEGATEIEPVSDEARRADEALREILSTLRARTRHDFHSYKRGTILRRLERRLQVHALPDLPSYRDFLRERPDETGPLLQDLLISVTNFFRDPAAFVALEKEGLPQLLKNRASDEPIRIWVAGCATGEEAYSVAMLVYEFVDHLLVQPEIQIFATDIDERAIAIGRTGTYPASIAADVSRERLRRFFNREQDQYRVVKALRETVLFASHNMLRDPPFSRIDLVCCRNVLIYLDRKVQVDILDTFRFALRPNGLLFLGTSESADAVGSAYLPLDKKHRLYRSIPDGRPRFAPLEPRDADTRVASAEPQRSIRRFGSYAEQHQLALERYAAPSILVDYDHNILHVSNSATRYLVHSAGVPTHQLLSNIAPALRLELRTALYKTSQSGRSVEARSVRHERDGIESFVNIAVLPVEGGDDDPSLLLLTFTEVEHTLREPADTPKAGVDAVVAQLEGELRDLKLFLQDTIEDAETSNEELKASNEELQAINEELRSTTEELETSKEELQSMNEELTTVNFELKVKFDEATKFADDLRNLIASTDIATIFVDNAFRLKRFTPRAVDVFNLLAGDIGRPLLDISHRLDYPQLADDVAAAFEQLKPAERRVTSRDRRTYLARVLPYRTADDKIEGAIITFIDVTALQRAETQVKAGEARLRLAVETMKDYGIVTTDETGTISTWNAGAERVFGFTAREAIGQPLGLVYTSEDRDAGVPDTEMRTAAAAGRVEEERWHVRKDGRLIFCNCVLTPFASDGLSGFVKVVRDTTDVERERAGREALLQEEHAARERSESANKLKDELLAVMSHELKHPLNLILVNAELLTRLDSARNEPAVDRAVGIIRKAVLGQGKIIDDLLDLSRSRTGKLTLELVPTDLKPLVETIVQSVAGDAAGREIALTFSATDDPLPVMADPMRLDQIVWNLLSNALKFTPAGGRIEIRLERDAGDALLVVRDDGKGIEPAFLPRVFDMFTQEHRGPYRDRGGLGIGLALAHEFVTAQGGRIEAVSAGVGKGATFSVRMPLMHAEPVAPQALRGAAKPFQGLRMLMVDDSQESLAPFVELLRLEGADAVGTRNGRDALACLESTSFDVLISDLAMPVMDGYELIAAVRQRPRLRKLLAIALSGFGRDKDREQAIAAGFDAHLGKPVSIAELRRIVGGKTRKSG